MPNSNLVLVYVRLSPRNHPYIYYIVRPDTIMTHIVGSQMILDGMIPAKLIDRQKRLTERACRSDLLRPIFVLRDLPTQEKARLDQIGDCSIFANWHSLKAWLPRVNFLPYPSCIKIVLYDQERNDKSICMVMLANGP